MMNEQSSIAPRVSVLMPVCNGEQHLAAAIESMLGQTMGDFELVAIDDGSTDSTLDILHGYAKRDARVRCVAMPKQGLVGALNHGLKLCRSNLVARMDADDVNKSNRLQKQCDRLQQQPNLVALGGAVAMLAEGRIGKPVPVVCGTRRVNWALKHGCPLAHPTVMFRKSAVLAVGGYRDKYLHAEDLDLWLRLSAGGDLDNLSEVVLHQRLHAGQISGKQLVDQALSAEACRHAWFCGESASGPANFARPIGHVLVSAYAGRIGQHLSMGQTQAAKVLLGQLIENAHTGKAGRKQHAVVRELIARVSMQEGMWVKSIFSMGGSITLDPNRFCKRLLHALKR